MPCRDYDDDHYRHEQYQELQEARRTIDQLTRMLCATCRKVEEFHNEEFLPHNTMVWWQKHRDEDKIREEKARKARETKLHNKYEKAEIVSKLTKKEAEKLGIGEDEYQQLADFLMRLSR